MLLIFDGMDKVGKTTLINAVDKATKYEHLMLDRGPVSYLVYDKLLNREDGSRAFENLRLLNDLESMNYLVIYLYSKEDKIYERLNKAGEILPNDLTAEEFLDEFNNQFFTLNRAYGNLLFLDTTKLDINLAVDKILSEINKINKTNELIKLRVKYESRDTNLLTNNDSYYIEYYPSYNVYSPEMISYLEFDIKVDKTYYKMLEAHLNQLLHKYKVGLINSRQIVYTSDDCITNVQYIPETVSGVLGELHITQRSLNIEHHGYNDLAFFVNWLEMNNIQVSKIYYNVLIPHKYNKYNFLKNMSSEENSKCIEENSKCSEEVSNVSSF